MIDHTQIRIKPSHFAGTSNIPTMLYMVTGDATIVTRGLTPREHAYLFGAEMFADTNVVGLVYTGANGTRKHHQKDITLIVIKDTEHPSSALEAVILRHVIDRVDLRSPGGLQES
jgi:hypothetical protein